MGGGGYVSFVLSLEQQSCAYYNSVYTASSISAQLIIIIIFIEILLFLP